VPIAISFRTRSGDLLAAMLGILRIVCPAATLVEALEPLRSDPSRSAVLLDIDGTLAPIVRHADDAHVPEATRSLLIEVAKRYRLVGCISGRRAATARQIVAIGSIAYVGNHGGELLRPGATHPELDPELAAWSERVRAFAARVYTSAHQRLRVRAEDKQAIAAFHWRGAPDEAAAASAVREIAGLAEAEGLAVHWGRKVLEVRPPVALDKGIGITALLDDAGAVDGRSPFHATGGQGGGDGGADGGVAVDGRSSLRAALYAGDDATDLDAFRGLRSLVQAGRLECAVCVAVSSDEAPPDLLAEADLAIEGPDGVRALLEALLS
jgi:trehalose 6-phosphate phosphatase